MFVSTTIASTSRRDSWSPCGNSNLPPDRYIESYVIAIIIIIGRVSIRDVVYCHNSPVVRTQRYLRLRRVLVKVPVRRPDCGLTRSESEARVEVDICAG